MSTINERLVPLRDGRQSRIRTSIPADARPLLDVRMAIARGDAGLGEEPDEIVSTVASLQGRIRRLTELPGCLHLTAEVDGVPRGCAALENGRTRGTAHTGELFVMVAPLWQRQRIGTALLSALLDWAEASPLIRVAVLSVSSANDGALALYERLGFGVAGRVTGALKLPSGELADTIFMTLQPDARPSHAR